MTHQTDDVSALVSDLRERIAAAGDPERAPQMQAYMKSTMPFRGVSAVPLRKICRETFDAHPLPDDRTWRSAVTELWDAAAYREERYAAIELTGHRGYRGFQSLQTLDLYRHLVVTGAWWDLVDPVATKRVGPILRQDPERVTPVMRSWALDDDLWLRRTAILCQLGSKDVTDVDLLRYAIVHNTNDTVHGRDFFIRKAVGWALREYAKTAPEWVMDLVSEHEAMLSGLSRREALRNRNVT